MGAAVDNSQIEPSAWCFCHIADMHVGSPRSFRYEPAFYDNWRQARDQIVEARPRFLLVGGDVTRDGNLHRFELERLRVELDGLPFPYHIVPGNMETANKITNVDNPSRSVADTSLNITTEATLQFCEVFGPPWWTVEYEKISISGFCDMLAGSGLPEEQELWRWVERQKKEWGRKPRGAGWVKIWVTHYPLFLEKPDEPTWDIRNPATYLNWYFSIDRPARQRLLETFEQTGTSIVISSHMHCRRSLLAGGIRYDMAPATSFSQMTDHWPDSDGTLGFLRYDVAASSISKAFVPLKRSFPRRGYGPGGHVPPEKQDYTLASHNKRPEEIEEKL